MQAYEKVCDENESLSKNDGHLSGVEGVYKARVRKARVTDIK